MGRMAMVSSPFSSVMTTGVLRTELTDRMVTAVKPRTFTGRDAFGVQTDKAYMKMCMTISVNLNVDASRMTVLEYYMASEYMQEMAKERQKAVAKAGKPARV